MNKKRTTRKKPSLYKTPIKSKICIQDDSKITVEQTKQVANGVSNNEEKISTITNIKANMHQKKFKQSRMQKIKEGAECNLTYENTDSSNSGNFSETAVNKEGSEINISFKDEKDKVTNFSETNGCSVTNSINLNGHNSVETDNYKLTVDINLVMSEILNNVCGKELKLEKLFYEQKNVLQADEDLSSLIKDPCVSNIKEQESNVRGMKDFLDSFSNKTKGNEREPKGWKDEDLVNSNYSENKDNLKFHTEYTCFKTVDKDNNKREIENDFVFKNSMYKKPKMDNIKNLPERKCIKENNETFQNRSEPLDSFLKIDKESMSISTNDSYILENSTLKENQTSGDTNTSNHENKTFNLTFQNKDENISLQENINPTAQFEEIFSNLKSKEIFSNTSMPGSSNAAGSIKNTLSIPCMSALAYFNTLKLTETVNSIEIENSKLSSSSKEINHSNTENLQTDKVSELKKELKQTEFGNSGNAKHANENETKHPTSHKKTFNIEVLKKEDISLNSPLTETNYYLDKTEPCNICPSNFPNTVSSNSNIKTQNNSGNESSIFSEEEFIAEKIIFREKEECDDNDAIPTGVFKHLNEIFEYNNETTSVHLKFSTSTKLDGFISDKTNNETISIDLKHATITKLDEFKTREANNEPTSIDLNYNEPTKLDGFIGEENVTGSSVFSGSVLL